MNIFDNKSFRKLTFRISVLRSPTKIAASVLSDVLLTPLYWSCMLFGRIFASICKAISDNFEVRKRKKNKLRITLQQNFRISEQQVILS